MKIDSISKIKIHKLREQFTPLYQLAVAFPRLYSCSFGKRKQVQKIASELSRRGYVFSKECYSLAYFKKDIRATN